jgi:alkylated DNA repair dioxygenase AlkB
MTQEFSNLNLQGAEIKFEYRKSGRNFDFGYMENFIPETEEKELIKFFTDLKRESKKVQQDANSRRWVCAFGDEGVYYRYNGQPHKAEGWSPLLRRIRDRTAFLCGQKFTHVVINFYENGEVGVGWHQDGELDIVPYSIVAGVSLGARRNFALGFYNEQGVWVVRHYTLEPRSLCLMRGSFQYHAWHSIPKEYYIYTMRISMTFRFIDNSVESIAKALAASMSRDPRPPAKLKVVIPSNFYRVERCRWSLHPHIATWVRYQAEEVFCKTIDNDFRESTAVREYKASQGQEVEFIFINEDWMQYENIIEFCKDRRIIGLIIAPAWNNERWFSILMEYSTHVFRLPHQKDVLNPLSKLYKKVAGPCPWQSFACVADFRHLKGKPTIFLDTPSIDRSVREAKHFPKRIILPLYEGKVDDAFPRNDFRIDRFVELTRSVQSGIPGNLVDYVASGRLQGYSTHYRGFGHWLQDYSIPDKENEEKMKTQIVEDLKKGRLSGPYDRPPFPNKFCPLQPKVCRTFAIRKNKYDPSDESIRIIFHKSYPFPFSKNNLTPRTDSGTEYWTFSKFLRDVATLSKGTLMIFADVKSAYKTLTVKKSEWYLQCFRIGNKFYFDKTCMFGDVAGGDGWDCDMKVDIHTTREVLKIPYLECYVDNTSILIEPLSGGRPAWTKGHETKRAYLNHHNYLRTELHKIIGPTLRTESHLGWGIDTEQMVVFIKEERRNHLMGELIIFTKRQTVMVTRAKFASYIGIINFLAPVIRCLLPPLRHLYEKQTRSERSGEKGTILRVTAHDKFIGKWLLYYLKRWSGITPITSTVWNGPQITIYTDAGSQAAQCGVVWGIGAWCRETGDFISEVWDKKIYDSAKTKSGSISAPFLECYGILASTLTLTPNGHRVLVYTDCSPAAQICSSRWCKTSTVLNKFIGYFDLECTHRDIFFQVEHLVREENYGAHYLSQGLIQKAQVITPIKQRKLLEKMKMLY